MGAYLEKLKAFANRIAMPQLRAQELEQMIRGVHSQVKSQVIKAEEANEVHLGRHNSDELLTRLEALFDGRVGEPMQPDVLAEARKEAKRRIENKIPPGYAEKDKADPSGDYLVWKQLLGEAAVRRVPVVLVTDDRKEDWVRREHGLTLGPRPELYEEMAAAASVPFFLMSTATFLRHAREYLSASVSPETVNQASELPAALDELRRAYSAEDLAAIHNQVRAQLQEVEEAWREALQEKFALEEMERAANSHDSVSVEVRQATRARREAAAARSAELGARRRRLSRLYMSLRHEQAYLSLGGDQQSSPMEGELRIALGADITSPVDEGEDG